MLSENIQKLHDHMVQPQVKKSFGYSPYIFNDYTDWYDTAAVIESHVDINGNIQALVDFMVTMQTLADDFSLVVKPEFIRHSETIFFVKAHFTDPNQ